MLCRCPMLLRVEPDVFDRRSRLVAKRVSRAAPQRVRGASLTLSALAFAHTWMLLMYDNDAV